MFYNVLCNWYQIGFGDISSVGESENFHLIEHRDWAAGKRDAEMKDAHLDFGNLKWRDR